MPIKESKLNKLPTKNINQRSKINPVNFHCTNSNILD